jgi:hypothetical protein
MGDLVPRKTLVNQLLIGAGGIIGGIVTMSLAGLGFLPGIIVGGIIAVIGLAATTSEQNRLAGLAAAGAGALIVLSKIPIFNLIATPLLWIGIIGLFGVGVYSLFKFIKNMAKRM